MLQAAAALYLIARTWTEPSGSLSTPGAAAGFTIVQVAFAVVGVFVAVRRPANAIGWVCLAVANLGFDILVSRYLVYREFTAPNSGLPDPKVLAAPMENLWLLTATAMVTLVAVFPQGRLSSRRMRTLIVALPFATLLAVGFSGFTSGPMPPPFEGYENPIGIGNATVLATLASVFMLLFVAGAIATAANMVYRFWHSQGEERQQFKWFALGASAIPTLMVTYLVMLVAAPDLVHVIDSIISVALIAIPVSIGIAVLRYRLYDIDIIIHRALVYGALTATTVGSYVCIVAVMSWSARTVVGEHNSQAVVASTTLIVAALFQPARRRIQSMVDRRFYRSRYNAGRTVEAFQSRLRDQTNIEDLRSDLAATVHSALQPASVGVWLAPGERR